jgi:AraC-like DNA-binding protein
MSKSIFCYLLGYSLADANHIIVVLILIVIALIVMGCYVMRQNRIISQRNEQLKRILTALDEYRAIVGEHVLLQDEQVEILERKQSQPKAIQPVQQGENLNFFVIMDARINKERPFADPEFNQDALIKFMGVSYEQFCELVPRYKEPERTIDYINSLRAEHAAKLLMEHSDCPTDDILSKCGFKNAAAYNSAFKFSFGVTPAEFLASMRQMFKNNKN